MITVRPRGESWQVDFRYTCHKTGKRKRCRRQSPESTKRKSYEWAVELKAELEAPPASMPAEVPTLEDFAPRYMSAHSEVYHKPSHSRTGRSILGKHLLPAFGSWKLDAITKLDVAEYTAEKLEDYAPQTVVHHINFLSGLLSVAVDWGLLESRPSFKRPRIGPVEWTYLEDDEVAAILRHLDSEPTIETLVPFMLGTGLRAGEALALRWEDVDRRARRAHICRSYSAGATTSPKSGRVQLASISLAVYRVILQAQQR